MARYRRRYRRRRYRRFIPFLRRAGILPGGYQSYYSRRDIIREGIKKAGEALGKEAARAATGGWSDYFWTN